MTKNVAWSDAAQHYLDGYLAQIGALLLERNEEGGETLQELRQHVLYKVEENAGAIVTVMDVRNVLAVVGSPEDIVAADPLYLSQMTEKTHRTPRLPRRRWFTSLPVNPIVVGCAIFILLNVVLLMATSIYRHSARFEEFSGSLPEGWDLVGNNSQNYVSGTAFGVGGFTDKTLFIRSEMKQPTGFAAVTRMIPANHLKGDRVTISTHIKSAGTEGTGHLYIRIEDAANNVIGFDNMQNRPIRGNVGPSEYKVVLDVPETASKIAYGVLLEGEGHIWFDTPEVTVTR